MFRIQSSIFIIILFLFISSCGLLDMDGYEPAYIEINEISFLHTEEQGPPSHDISIVQIFFEGQSLGYYEFPLKLAVVPTMPESELVIQAAVSENSQSYAIESYAMMEQFTVTQEFIPGEVYQFEPVFKYLESVGFAFAETFEASHIFQRDMDDNDTTKMVTTEEMAAYGLQSGVMEVFDNLQNIVANDFRSQGIIEGGQVFLEYEFKSDIFFSVGFIAFNPGSTVNVAPIIEQPSEEWKKVYLELTLPMLANPAEEYSIFFAADHTNGDGKVYLDNVKLIYRK